MNVSAAKTLAHDLMADYIDPDVHGHWSFAWSNAKKTFGRVNYPSRTLYLSRPMCELNSDARMEDTIRHEIAHILAGRGAKHGPVWKAMARKVGATPHATHRADAPVPAKWEATCLHCGREFKRHRLTRNVRWASSCPKCGGGRYNPIYQLIWKEREAA